MFGFFFFLDGTGLFQDGSYCDKKEFRNYLGIILTHESTLNTVIIFGMSWKSLGRRFQLSHHQYWKFQKWKGINLVPWLIQVYTLLLYSYTHSPSTAQSLIEMKGVDVLI